MDASSLAPKSPRMKRSSRYARHCACRPAFCSIISKRADLYDDTCCGSRRPSHSTSPKAPPVTPGISSTSDAPAGCWQPKIASGQSAGADPRIPRNHARRPSCRCDGGGGGAATRRPHPDRQGLVTILDREGLEGASCDRLSRYQRASMPDCCLSELYVFGHPRTSVSDINLLGDASASSRGCSCQKRIDRPFPIFHSIAQSCSTYFAAVTGASRSGNAAPYAVQERRRDHSDRRTMRHGFRLETGWVARTRLLGDGRRSIMTVFCPG